MLVDEPLEVDASPKLKMMVTRTRGFLGKILTHPDQVDCFNSFSRTAREFRKSERIKLRGQIWAK